MQAANCEQNADLEKCLILRRDFVSTGVIKNGFRYLASLHIRSQSDFCDCDEFGDNEEP